VRELFRMMRRLTASGVTIVFVSHDIDEVMEVTDRCTVLRDGAVIGTFETARTGRAALVEAIVGRSLSVNRRVATLPSETPAVEVRGLTGAVVHDISLSVQPGEILGLTGLIGSGYDEVPMLLAGARRARAGVLTMAGAARDVAGLEPGDAMDARIAYIPADRQRAGIAPDLTLAENATLPLIRGSFTLSHSRLRARAADLLARFSVKAQSSEQAASELSGGNQQKLVLGKWLQLRPRLVLLDEPTQGIDVGARQEIYDRLLDVCAEGAAVICATSEFEQLEIIAHRVLIFDNGRVRAELKGDSVTKSAIANACYRAGDGHAAQ